MHMKHSPMKKKEEFMTNKVKKGLRDMMLGNKGVVEEDLIMMIYSNNFLEVGVVQEEDSNSNFILTLADLVVILISNLEASNKVISSNSNLLKTYLKIQT